MGGFLNGCPDQWFTENGIYVHSQSGHFLAEPYLILGLVVVTNVGSEEEREKKSVSNFLKFLASMFCQRSGLDDSTGLA